MESSQSHCIRHYLFSPGQTFRAYQVLQMAYCPPGSALTPIHHSVPPHPLPKKTVELRFIDEKTPKPPPFPDFSVPPPTVPRQNAGCHRLFKAAGIATHPKNRNAPPMRQNDQKSIVVQDVANVAPPSTGRGLGGRSRSTWNKGKSRNYAKGINGPERSDYEKSDKIPVFEVSELEKERKMCEAIFEILRKNTRISLEILFGEVDGLGFSNKKELQTFLETRPHLFEKTWKWETIRNRGFGYRRGMVYLSSIILNNESDHPEGAKLTEIFKEVADLPTYHMDDMWADDYLWLKKLEKDDFLKFLRRNSSIFELTINDPEKGFETAYVKIKPLAKGVPSLWDSTLLSSVQDYHRRLGGQVFFDKSRTFHAMGHVNYSCDKYARIVISEGPFLGRSVHVDPSVAKLKGRRMSEVFPINFKAAVVFYFALFYGEHFHCVEIKSEKQLEEDDDE